MKVIFLGATKFSKEMLLCLIQENVNISTIFSIPEEFHISYSKEKIKNYNYSDLSIIAANKHIEFYEVDSLPGKRLTDYYELIRKINPDIILVLGWYFMVPKKIRNLSKNGAWGIHASLLPRYAGNAPLVWAMINGEKETGVTLFKLDDGVDDGDIITQKALPIEFSDTINEVYEKATKLSKKILVEAISHINNLEFKHQDKSKIEVYPPRSPRDGKIDSNKSALEIYNFIRAQTKPYPGAFSTVNGKKIIFWQVKYCNVKKNIQNISSSQIFENSGKVYLKLKDGCLEIIKVNYDGKDEELSSFKIKLAGNRIGT
jgi:methionyl-tRNA formyltransferase